MSLFLTINIKTSTKAPTWGWPWGFTAIQLLTNRNINQELLSEIHSSPHSRFYLWIRIEHTLTSHFLGPSQDCLPPWCFNIMPSTFIEGLCKKEPHEAHFCICCEIGIKTLPIKLFSVLYLRPIWELALSLVPGGKKCALFEKVVNFILFS